MSSLSRAPDFDLHLGRFTVFVGPEEGEIEAVAGVGEVVGVAAEGCDGLFGGEDEADVGVFFVLIEVVPASGEEGDDVAAVAGVGGALLFEGGGVCAAEAGGFGRGGGVGSSGLYFFGDRFDLQQDVDFEAGAGLLISKGAGGEAVFHVVVLFGRYLVDTVGADVVVGEQQTVGGDERTGPAVVKPDRRELERIEKLVGDREAEPFPDVLAGELIEQPHALFGPAREGSEEQEGGKRKARHGLHFYISLS